MTALREKTVTPANILAHEDYREFRRRHLRKMVLRFVQSRIEDRIGLDPRQQVTSRLVVGLNAAADPNDERTWARVTQLQSIVARSGLASRRLVTDIIARLRGTGLIEVRRAGPDARIRLLVPSPAFVASDRSFLAGLLANIDLFYPDGRYDAIYAEDVRAHATYRGAWAYRVGRTIRPFLTNGPMGMLYSRDAGIPALYVVLGDQMIEGRCELSFAQIGEKLGVSRTQIRDVFSDGAAMGLFSIARGGGVTILPPMVEAFDRLLSENIVAYNSVLDDIRSGQPLRV